MKVFQVSSESEPDFQGSPFPAQNSCSGKRVLFGLITLRSFVLIVLGLDLLLGLLYIAETYVLLSMVQLVPKARDQLILSVISNSVSVLLLLFALSGLVAVLVGSKRWFRVYLGAKGVEVAFMLVFWLSIMRKFCREGDLTCEVMTFAGVFAQKGVFNVTCLYYLYQAYTGWGKRLASMDVRGEVEMKASKLNEEGGS